jgi:CubicO group peptidase (beta-lactamase class C family)
VNGRELADLLREHASKHSVPGAAIGVHRAGASTTAYYGVVDVTTGEAVTPETAFSIGSLTKSMVATVVLRLAQEGSVSLEDPVAERVPELRGVGWAERATLRDLLANRSGLPLRNELEIGFARRKNGDVSGLAADVATATAASEVWSYTNVGWCLLGRVMEVATGLAWEEAMRRHLFERVEMRRALFATEGVPRARVSGHEIANDRAIPVGPLVSRAYGPAGASLVATLSDVLSFAALHLDDPSLAPLRTTHADISISAWLDSWCLGYARFDWDGGPVWGWDGLINGERSFLRLIPEHHAAVALMTNCNTGRAMYRSLFTELMRSLFEIGVPALELEPSLANADDLSRFAGAYGWPDRLVDVTATPSGLIIHSEESDAEVLTLDDHTFLVNPMDPDNPTVTFGAFDATARPQVLYLMLWGVPRLDK